MKKKRLLRTKSEPRQLSVTARGRSDGRPPLVVQFDDSETARPSMDDDNDSLGLSDTSTMAEIDRILRDDVLVRPTFAERVAERYHHRPSPRALPWQPVQQSDSRPSINSIASSSSRPASLLTGTMTLRLSVMSAVDSVDDSISTTERRSMAPRDLLDLEAGRAVLFTDHADPQLVTARRRVWNESAKDEEGFLDDRQELLSSTMARGTMKDLSIDNQVGWLGRLWRAVLQHILFSQYDSVNAKRVSRLLQLQLPFQTAYESYLTSQLIESLDKGHYDDIERALGLAFSNRNVSRVLVQSLGPRFDFLWHWSTAVRWNRLFDAMGQFPLIGITRFPATENFPSTRNHALASIFRVVLGEGNWVTRVVTGGREGLITDNPHNLAQNLAAESNGFELANRNQYGTHFGRKKTNDFRLAHRLPTDESLVRTFVAQPMPTMTNNGAVHTLRQLANHWRDMLDQEWGNFAHQRMEQLDPFETLRFHMPDVLVLLSSLRGRNNWDNRVLGPMIARLQNLRPGLDTSDAKRLVEKLQELVIPVTGGVASLVDPFRRWLQAIAIACIKLEREVVQVYEIVTSVEIGIRLGYDIVTQVDWKVPADRVLKTAILQHIRGHRAGEVNEQRIRRALQLTTPRDKRTLMELVQNDLVSTKPAQLLLNRVKTLLQRELRREVLNETIRKLSMGDYMYDELAKDEWYWLEEEGKRAVHVFQGPVSGRRGKGRFLHVDSGFERIVSMSKVKVRGYVPVAESITRAQKAYMTIELDHGKRFKHSAFMEFSFLRIALGRLAVVAQMACEELDNARLNLLREVQRCNQMQVAPNDLVVGETYYAQDTETLHFKPFVLTSKEMAADRKIVKVLPQNVIVVGGGPTGLITAIHCTENCLASGGVMKLYEARDAFAKGGSTFERAQIVRLDARWIAMLRYHLGTAFEDHYIALAGETDSQLGNTLPSQGFVEITIKDLENMLHVEVSRLWSRGVLAVFTNSKAQYDLASNSLTKHGENLKVGDVVLRRLDPTGNKSADHFPWRVVELTYTKPLELDDLKVGQEYGVYVRAEQAVMPFLLVAVNLDTKEYNFRPLFEGMDNLKAHARSLPSVYPAGTDTKAHANVRHVVFESVVKVNDSYVRDELALDMIKDAKFTLDVGNTHVVEAIGKPHDSTVHLLMTTTEPYAVCCLQGLKVSMLMHNFGEKRWGSGLVDDLRSLNDQNTRIVGDFTKMVRVPPIIEKMSHLIYDDRNWQLHFKHLVASSGFPELDEFDPILPKLFRACNWLAVNATAFRRQTLQTRFFETGDNFYLGMEFPREYDSWKTGLVDYMLAPLTMKKMSGSKRKRLQMLRGTLMHHVDRLYYTACLDALKRADVYNPGARRRVPDLHLINSYVDESLGKLPVGESFRLSSDTSKIFEILVKWPSTVIVRNVEGYVSRMSRSTLVKRESNLTRGPDGNEESKVALASFPVGHYVNYRTMRVSDAEKGYVFAFAGDSQSTPHFMRYSGLTGAAINAMSFSRFIKHAADGMPFEERLRNYSNETNWSNGEVVKRGTGANYGDSGFLRPGFSYKNAIAYLRSKVAEHREGGQDPSNVLSRDWKIKFAASLVPRGLEMNDPFMAAVATGLHMAIVEILVAEVRNLVKDAEAPWLVAFETSLQKTDPLRLKPTNLLDESYLDKETRKALELMYTDALSLSQLCKQILELAREHHLYNKRISSELVNQPKPVDSIVDDFAVEAQNFANSLTLAAAFAAGALALRLFHVATADVFSAILGGLNIAISFGTMANVGRYKVRNEESRTLFMDEKFSQVKKAVFSLMDSPSRQSIPLDLNPFVVSLEEKVAAFREVLRYYGYDEPVAFNAAYMTLKGRIENVDHVRAFQHLVCTKYLAHEYHVNSYVQASLVEVCRCTTDLLTLLTDESSHISTDQAAKELFMQLNVFEPSLAASIQRGPVRWGFVKKRKLSHWDFIVALRYFYSHIFCGFPGAGYFVPIHIKIRGVLEQTRSLSLQQESKVLRRQVRDLEQLYWATRESDIASLIFLAAVLGFVASILFTIGRIFSIDKLDKLGFWALMTSALGAILAAFHFVRKLRILVRLWLILGTKTNHENTGDLGTVRSVTFTQVLLTLTRLLAAATASVALPFAVAEQGFGDRTDTSNNLPFWIALVSVVTAVGATILFFFVEFYIRYNLTPTLGPFVCECFRPEILSLYETLALPANPMDPPLVQERETWEYVAREFLHEYRFDTVFAADRFGAILQYIQSGMDPRPGFI